MTYPAASGYCRFSIEAGALDTRYWSCAPYYDRGRLQYPADLRERLISRLGLQPGGRLLDIGCGTGSIALALTPAFDEVVGLDVDHGMLRGAVARAGAAGRPVSYVRARAEQLPFQLGQFTVITCALAFHWTSRAEAAQCAYRVLRPNGWFLKISRSQPDWSPPSGMGPRPPMDRVRHLVRSYIGNRTHSESTDDLDVLHDAGFLAPEVLSIPGGTLVTRTIDDIVAKVFSQADYAPHLFGDRLEHFEADLRAMLSDTTPEGHFTEREPDCEVTAWRRPSS
jgi:ubiquinone/menaquinone biosynthesis C-methylase UbiE